MRATGIQRDPIDDAFLQPLIGRARAALSPAAANAAERAGDEAGYEEYARRRARVARTARLTDCVSGP